PVRTARSETLFVIARCGALQSRSAREFLRWPLERRLRATRQGRRSRARTHERSVDAARRQVFRREPHSGWVLSALHIRSLRKQFKDRFSFPIFGGVERTLFDFEGRPRANAHGPVNGRVQIRNANRIT